MSIPGAERSSAPGHSFSRQPTFVTKPAPTVRPPSRMAKRMPGSQATGLSRRNPTSARCPGVT